MEKCVLILEKRPKGKQMENLLSIVGIAVLHLLSVLTFIWVFLALVNAIFEGNRRDIIGAGVLLFIFSVPPAHKLWIIIREHVLLLGWGGFVFRLGGILFLLALLGWALTVFLWLINPASSLFDLICPPEHRRRRK